MGRRLSTEESRKRLHQMVGIVVPAEPEPTTADILDDLRAQLIKKHQAAKGDEKKAIEKAAGMVWGIDPTIDSIQFARIFNFAQACLLVGPQPRIDEVNRNSQVQAKRAQNKAQLTQFQQSKVFEFIERQSEALGGITEACKEASKRLINGTLPGLCGVRVEYEPGGIRTLYYRIVRKGH